jgi:hypothetical protein
MIIELARRRKLFLRYKADNALVAINLQDRTRVAVDGWWLACCGTPLDILITGRISEEVEAAKRDNRRRIWRQELNIFRPTPRVRKEQKQ